MNFELRVDYDGQHHGDIYGGMGFDRGGHSYDVFTHNLGYNTFHCVAISRRPGFMTTMDDEAIWQQLNDDRFTTPVLREWTPYIKSVMLKRDLIVPAKGYGCACGFMVASNDHLDEIVQAGLQVRRLRTD